MTRPQTLPAEYAEKLTSLRDAALAEPYRSTGQALAYRRYSGYITVLVTAGWRPSTIGPAAGVSRQAIQQIRAAYEPLDAGWPPVVHAPITPPRVRVGRLGPPRSPSLPDDIRDRLDALRRASEGCRGPFRGTAKIATPEWRAGAEFADIVDALITDGPYTTTGIARALGITRHAIDLRLARHDHRPFAPSATPVRERAS